MSRRHSPVALDVDVVRLLVSALDWKAATGPDAESTAAARIYFYLTNPLVTPTVAAEIGEADDPALTDWKTCRFDEIADPDDFFRGCVKGMADRYLDYHPDPRDCRVVAEAECAKAEAFLSLDAELVRGLSGRSEAIHVLSPTQYWRRAHVAPGAPPRIHPAESSPLYTAAWWRW
jgi:hypothetical protein